MNIQQPPRHGKNQSLEAAVAEAEERYVAANPGSRRLADAARSTLPGGNTRTTLFFSPFPLYMAGGKGSTLTDVDGHTYVDFVNEYTAGLFGHSHPVVKDAIETALGGGLNLGAPTAGEVELSAAIRRRFPAMELLRFCNSGTEANLLALATARAHTGKSHVMIFDAAYHGSLFYFGHGPSPLNMPFPVVTSTFNDPERAANDIARHAKDLAAVIVEPMQGSGGALAGTPEFLRALREATARHGVLLVYDEVMTSRAHKGGLQARDGIRPDLVTLGKYLGGGITFGAFGGRADVMARFDPANPDAWPHGGTFNNNVLAMTAGARVVNEVLTDEALDRLNALGDSVRERLNALGRKHALPVQATGVGSIFGLHFHDGPIRNAHDIEEGAKGREDALASLKKLFHLDMLAAGVYIARRGMGNLSLASSEADADTLVAAVDEFLASRADLIRA
ncbi:MAG: aminotransferase class III-fold pyridoxal phosphate-dependent enzyme [Hyphomicrobiales bacterium]